jgi:PAS domain S-box-containing protein
MKIRSHLLLLVLAAVCPIVIFSAIMTAVFWREQRHALEQRYLERVRAMALALDRELEGTILSLELLAQSPYLKSGDLRRFHEQAAGTRASDKPWVNIILNDPASGRQVLNLRMPYGAPLYDSTVDRATLESVVKTGQPYVASLIKNPISGQYMTAVVVAATGANGRRYALLASIEQSSWLSFLESYPLAPDATMTLLDQNGVIIARTLNNDKWVGQRAAAPLYERSRKSFESAYRSVGLDGDKFYCAHARSKLAAWTVATAVPEKSAEAVLREWTIVMAAGAAGSSILAVVLAFMFGSRIARPVSDLARSAQALATGERVDSHASADVAEVTEVRAAFYEAAERLRAQDSALRESEQRFRSMADTAPVFIWVSEADKRCTYFNKPWLDFTGRTLEQELNDGWEESVHPEDLARCHETYTTACDARETFDMEYRLRRADGQYRWMLDRGSPRFSVDGTFLGYIGSAVDITERKQAEQTVLKLLVITEKLNSTLEVDTLLDLLVSEAIQIVDAGSGTAGLFTADGMVCRKFFLDGEALPLDYCWPPMRGLAGWLIVHKIPYLTNEAEADPQIDRDFRARFGIRSALSIPILNVQREVIGFFEIHNKKHAGGFTDADKRTLMAISEAAAIAIQNAIAYRNVQSAQESLRNADRRKDEYLAMLGHELRNPLGVISMTLQMQRMQSVPPSELPELQEIVERQVHHMTRLLNDLLDVSRIARGQLRLDRETCDFAAVVRDSVEDYRANLEASGLNVQVDIPDRPVWVLGDRTRLAQSVGNILHNANKFTGAGGTVSVALREDAAGQQVILTVRDTGVGMDAEVLERIFEPFTQGDRGIDRSPGGLGLGLALVKGLIELHGGKVRASSAGPGQGFELAIRLPLKGEAAPAVKPVAPSAEISRSHRILVIEDNPMGARTMEIFLSRKGHAVEVAHTGREGVEAARRFRPEVILCDIGLPEFDGYRVAEEIRKQAGLGDVYIIGVSGYGHEQDKARAWRAGFNAYLVKPVDMVELETLLAKFAQQRD